MRDNLNHTPSAPPPPRRSALWTVAGIACVILLLSAAGFLFLMKTGDVQRVPPHLIGSVWTAEVEGRTNVYFVTREDRAVTRSYDPQGQYTYDHTYSVYTLHARAAADGAPAAPTAAVELARIDTTSVDFKKYQVYRTLPDGPGILGPQADVLWLWNGGLEARDARTLGVVWTPAGAPRGIASPAVGGSGGTGGAGTLPDDPKYVKVIWGAQGADGRGRDKPGGEKGPFAGVLVFKSADARYLAIDRASGTYTPVDEAALAQLSRAHTKTADTAFETLGPSPWGPGGMSLSSVSVSGLIHNAILDDGTWRALLTADQRAALDTRVGILEEWSIRQGLVAENASSLYAAPITLDPSRTMQRTSMMIDPAKVQPVAGAAGAGGAAGAAASDRFLLAGFLRRPGTFEAWMVGAGTGPDSSARSMIVLHRQAIGDKSPWLLTRLGIDGVRHWTADTGLTELDHVSDGGASIVLTGRVRSDRPQAEWPERMVFVNDATGTPRTLEIATDSMTPATP